VREYGAPEEVAKPFVERVAKLLAGDFDNVQQDRDSTAPRSLSQPVKLVAGDWDNEADDDVTGSVPLTDDFFDLGAVG
jgi:hypothetical protein